MFLGGIEIETSLKWIKAKIPHHGFYIIGSIELEWVENKDPRLSKNFPVVDFAHWTLYKARSQ